jgi:2'-5' RNA ligase
MAGNLIGPGEVYERLWVEATDAFDRGGPRLDPFLKDRAGDRRRGVTLVARPDGNVRRLVESFLRDAAQVAPGQYFYQPPDFHVTVYSVIPGSTSWKESAQRLPDYLAVLDRVLKKRPAFSVAFRGVTASPEAVLIQGFPVGNALNELRDELSRQSVADTLARRYKIVAAHLTVMRFTTPMKDWMPLRKFLAGHRETDFGETRVEALQLIESDWYGSAGSVRTLREYPLL